MKASNIDIIIASILLCIIALGFFSFFTFIITILLTLILFFNSDRSTVGVFLIWIFFKTSGLWGNVLNIPKPGLITFLIALLCFYFVKFNYKINFRKSLSQLIPIFLLFLTFFFYGPMHSYSIEKIFYIIYKGVFYLIAFLLLILNPKINYPRLSLLLLISAFQYYSYITIYTGWTGPEHLFDFGTLRSYYTLNWFELDEQTINYQEIGLLGVISFSFIINLIPTKNSLKKNNYFFFLILLSILFVVLYSGSRQSVYSFPIIFVSFLLFDKKISRNSKKWSLIIFIILCSFFIFSEFNNNESNLTLSEGNTIIEKINRPNEMLHAFYLIQSKPLLGHGLGGFTPFYNNTRYYPHNIILELLSETGFLGFTILLVYFFVFLRINKVSLSNRSNSGFLIFPVFLALFIRANLSSDLMETIYVFSFLIGWGSLYHFNNKYIYNLMVLKFGYLKQIINKL